LTAELLNNRYRVEKQLGRGGFAVTYLASDTQLNFRPVVVKVLLDYQSEDPWILKKFRQEMQALALLDHPAIVGALDSGQLSDGKPFLVMQFVKGQRLRDAMTSRGMDFHRAANILRQVSHALSAAHEAGICHRDVKPENIMLQSLGDGEEQAKLIDFGIASIRDSKGSTTDSTKVAGSLEYMALEQFDGKSSPASDVYALGVVAYEMLTGRHPFCSETMAEMFRMQMEGVRLKPRDLRPRLPEAAQDCILKALSTDPAKRYERARDFGDALARALTTDASTEPHQSDFVDGNAPTQPPKDKPAQTIAKTPQSVGRLSRLQWLVGVSLSFVVVAGGLVIFSYRMSSPNSVATIQVPAVQTVPQDPANNNRSAPPPPVEDKTIRDASPSEQLRPIEVKKRPDAVLPRPRRALTLDEYGGPVRGELQWSGNLASHETLTIQAGHVLAGSLTGDLPLVPVAIDLEPSGIAIVESPSAQNSWDRIVVRNASTGKITSITVRWRLER
jgi:serine/threonine-protein kinase